VNPHLSELPDSRRWLERVNRQVRAQLRPEFSLPELLVAISALVFTLFATAVSAEHLLAFDLHAYDFGLFAAVALGTARLTIVPAFPHFSPIFYATAPLFAAFPSEATLVVVQAAALGATAFPLFWLARARLGNEWAALVASVAILFGFIPLALAWNGFAPECFLPAAFLAALYARERLHLLGFVAALVIALAATETALPLVVLLGVATIARWAWQNRKGDGGRTTLRLGTAALGLAGAWYLLVLSLPLVVPGANSGPNAYLGTGFTVAWWNLGATSVGEVFPLALLHPSAAWNQLTAGWPGNAVYLVLLFGTLGFLALLGPLDELLLGLVWPALAVLSSLSIATNFDNAFVAYSFPFLAAAAVGGAARLARWIDRSRASSPPTIPGPRLRAPRRLGLSVALAILITGAVATTAVASPLLGEPVSATLGNSYGWPQVTPHDHYLLEVARLVPPDAHILTTNGVYPILATDPYATSAPVSPFADLGRSYVQVLAREINDSDFVLLDYLSDWQNTMLVVTYGNLSAFHVLGALNGIRLLERGPTPEAPAVTGAESWTVPLSALIPVYGRLGTSPAGTPELFSQPGSPPRGFIWVGPYFYGAPPGTYRATLNLSVDDPVGSLAVELQGVEHPVTIVPVTLAQNGGDSLESFQIETGGPAEEVLSSQDESVGAGTTQLSVSFEFVWNGTGVLEFPGKLMDPAATVALQSMTFEVVAPLA